MTDDAAMTSDPTMLRARLAWSDDGALHDGAIRYLLVRPDSLMGMFRRLGDGARGEALAALQASLREHGARSLCAYMEREGLGAEGVYRRFAMAGASGVGWGAWRFVQRDDDRFAVEVVNSPFAIGYGDSANPVCAAIAGMLEAIAELLWGQQVRAVEMHCAAQGRDGCRFDVWRECGERVSAPARLASRA